MAFPFTPAYAGQTVPHGLVYPNFAFHPRIRGADEIRPEQMACYKAISDALNNHRIGMIEASTGTGKSLAAMGAAVIWTGVHHARACIAVPTLALIRQFIAEYKLIARVRHNAMPRLRVFFGKKEFISAQALRALLRTQPELAERFPLVDDWLRQHGPTIPIMRRVPGLRNPCGHLPRIFPWKMCCWTTAPTPKTMG